MRLLAVDTSSDACSVALQCDAGIIERHVLQPKEHTRLLMPMIESVLEEAGVAASDLDGIAAGIGPGSFIGVRIAVSVVQGIAYAGGHKVLPVSSLAAVAAECFEIAGSGLRVAVAQDAHRQQVYLGRFVCGKDGLPEAVQEAALQDIGPIAGLAPDVAAPPWHAAGAGWRRYPELLAANADCLAGVIDVACPRARCLLPMAAALLREGRALDPAELEPAYLRHQVAKESPAGP